MPEYLAPGVYVEEVSYRSKSIEGVSTTTTGFVGPTRYGPIEGEPELVTSLGEFERIYGDGHQLEFEPTKDKLESLRNYVWHAVRSFFDQGGKRLYVQRVFNPVASEEEDKEEAAKEEEARSFSSKMLGKGPAPATAEDPQPEDLAVVVRARFPGQAGRRRVRLTLALGQNLLSGEDKL
ncbi:MAG TPA: hypothetical protein VF729_08495, partial [Solirubrobacterales bacterium]